MLLRASSTGKEQTKFYLTQTATKRVQCKNVRWNILNSPIFLFCKLYLAGDQTPPPSRCLRNTRKAFYHYTSFILKNDRSVCFHNMGQKKIMIWCMTEKAITTSISNQAKKTRWAWHLMLALKYRPMLALRENSVSELHCNPINSSFWVFTVSETNKNHSSCEYENCKRNKYSPFNL